MQVLQRLSALTRESLPQIQNAAIAIMAHDARQRHVGLLFKDGLDEDVFLLHLKWNNQLAMSCPSEEYIWAEPPSIPQKRLRQLAAMCRLIWSANGSDIPFAFDYPNGCFDRETGKLLLDTNGSQIGLTCATFVLAVFQSVGLTIVDCDSWPRNRPEDANWHQWIILNLKQTNASQAELDKVKKQAESGCARFRPEEVCGSVLKFPPTVPHPQVIELSEAIAQRLTDRLSELRNSKQNS
jgi:hypothetical protein